MFTSNKAKSLLGVGLAACLGAIAFQSPTKAESLSKKLSLLSKIRNQTLPVMLDPNIRVDSTFVGPGKVFGYNYTLVNHSAAEIDGSQLVRSLRPVMVDNFCNNYSARFFRENKVSIKVKFYDNHRNLVGRVKVSPSECR